MTHANYPHPPGTLYDCPACESTCVCDGAGECVACQRCADCGADLSAMDDPRDHGCADDVITDLDGNTIGLAFTDVPTVPVSVEIHRTDYYLSPVPADVPLYDVSSYEPEWERVGEGTTTTETYEALWDEPDYRTPLVWAAARIRDLSCDHNLAPSVYPLGESVAPRTWLSATYENPYHSERRETSAYVYGVSETDRAEVFRMAMLDGPAWVAILHAHRYPGA